MKKLSKILGVLVLASTGFSLSATTGATTGAIAEISVGDNLQTLSNLHPDFNKSRLYTLNYQLPALIPVCEPVVVKKLKKKKMVFEWQGREFTITYEKHTKKAGVSFQESLADYFGPECDKIKMATLGKKDREGIRTGQPSVGMTKAGILFAMGRPPHHATPTLESQRWMYWLNKFKRKAILFDEQGNVTRVKL